MASSSDENSTANASENSLHTDYRQTAQNIYDYLLKIVNITPRSSIFHDASVKLASLYLLVIMIISFLFSFWLYNVSLMEIKQSILRIPGPIQRVLLDNNPNFARELRASQIQAVEDSRENLIFQLVILNISIAFVGASTSYYFARRTLRPIERAHEAQSRFTADASHELRTPIAAMRLENEIALMDENLTVIKARSQLVSTIEELDKLTTLSEGLLELARLETVEIKKYDLRTKKLIDAATARVRVLAADKNQNITIDIPKKSKLYANESTAIEALVTLLENAITYGSIGSEIHIKVANNQHESTSIAVSDKGSGISSEDLPHIYERFYRSDSSRSKDSSSNYGIGLSIAKSIMEAHRGDISVKTSKNGSTFVLTFPHSG